MLLPLFFCKSIFFLYVYYSSEYNRWCMKLPIYPFDNTFQGAYLEEEIIMRKYVYNIFNAYFIEQLFIYCYEQLEQLRILLSGVIYMTTGKEVNSFQSKLFLVLGTVSVVILGMTCPMNYYIKIISLLYKTAKQYRLLYRAYKVATDEDIRNFKRRSIENHYMDFQEKEILTQVRELDESDVPEAIREQIKEKEAQM